MTSGETSADFPLQGVTDPRLAVHAAGAQPAWLWSFDGARILWSNPVGACVFGAANAGALASRNFGSNDFRRQQVSRLADRLPPTGAVRLERLRGFGATLGGLVTCACARLDFPNGTGGILVTCVEPLGGSMPLIERLQRLAEGIDTPVAAFAHDGQLVSASDAAQPLLGFRSLAGAGLEGLREEALRDGHAETSAGQLHVALQRVGSGSDVGFLALLTPHAANPSTLERRSEPQSVPPSSNETTVFPTQVVEPAAHPALDASHSPDTASRDSVPRMRRHPLRFMWRMDADGRFSLGSDDFTRAIGMRTAAGFGRLWSEITEVFGLDPEGRVAKAIATRDTWSGITLLWPVDGSDARLPVELSGLPVYDRARNFAGYRGFGVCRDREGLARLAAHRRHEFLFNETSHPQPAATSAPDAADAPEFSVQPAEPDTVVEPPKNVLPFRSSTDLRPPSLTPVENNAFHELARQLSARLEGEQQALSPDAITERPVTQESPPNQSQDEPRDDPNVTAIGAQEDGLSLPKAAPTAPQADPARDRPVLDLLPTGVMIYRLDRVLYANHAFLTQVGYDGLVALEQAGGLNALLVESGLPVAEDTPTAGSPVTISATAPSGARQQPIAARLFVINWDGEPAHALICATAPPSPVDQATAEELGAILDTTTEGILMFDNGGRITASNRGAETLFGHSGDSLTQLNLADLFAPESQDAVRDYLSGLAGGSAGLPDQGREVLGCAREGRLIPLSMTMGRMRADGRNFFAVFRDLSQTRKAETELSRARRQADHAASARADVLARISHEIRTPLNAIIGFADVMGDEKFGPLGNERYGEYMKDIRASGERIIAFIDDLLDLSRIETGKLDLAFVNQNLNELVEQCVAVMQPQANRERIIIRTSLAHTLPPVVADAQALRQITLNLIGNSIHLANAGGQVIVSTALTDFGDVALRVRDTGHGLNDNEVAAATEPFRTPAPSDRASESAGVSLSLTKALVEANRAQFNIRTGPHSGTLIEVVFAQAKAQASE
ncbi:MULTISPECIES: PAS domain-containing sensor histidine kinase [unclassified Nitrobacter]|uniref:sensor histidine kinase n=1 Tax=unclassified Nitrobacter TaxID=2620411 RepID=UPI0009273193|nr:MULTISPECIES: PAS domain-containing sensor histidine kinase [unclassified Nitrobacter]MBN9146778.1 PAS domain S-box protein [Nitrobacter sp.]OJV01207.1 MAG: PAS domain-containing sensor histidine kinase [Nitrobacter sp. 62-23]